MRKRANKDEEERERRRKRNSGKGWRREKWYIGEEEGEKGEKEANDKV